MLSLVAVLLLTVPCFLVAGLEDTTGLFEDGVVEELGESNAEASYSSGSSVHVAANLTHVQVSASVEVGNTTVSVNASAPHGINGPPEKFLPEPWGPTETVYHAVPLLHLD